MFLILISYWHEWYCLSKKSFLLDFFFNAKSNIYLIALHLRRNSPNSFATFKWMKTNYFYLQNKLEIV
jgi:hypothetical protein